MADTANSDSKQTRRRGSDLEDALLDAAWEQLIAEGYEHFTFDTIAARARTSKPVLYRRWKAREDLLRAAIRHRGAIIERPVVDTGTLRGDVLTLLSQANRDRSPLAALFSSMLGSYFDQGGLTPAELRGEFLAQRGSSVTEAVDRAVERGEVDPARLTPRIIDLPFDLWRHEMMMTLKAVPDHVLRQIVDDIFLPLVIPQPPATGEAPPPGAGSTTAGLTSAPWAVTAGLKRPIADNFAQCEHDRKAGTALEERADA
jgi:AcrR family transcriptional regulator